jgi:hypothetical protein
VLQLSAFKEVTYLANSVAIAFIPHNASAAVFFLTLLFVAKSLLETLYLSVWSQLWNFHRGISVQDFLTPPWHHH